MNDSKIDDRIRELENKLIIGLARINCEYDELSEVERIPFRVMQAEILALKEYSKGEDLYFYLNNCIEMESYCGAEGIKRAKEFLNQSI